MEPFPDLGSLSDADLKQLIDDLTKEELEVSYRRRILHGRIDLLRAELQARLQKTGGKSVLDDGRHRQARRHPRRQGSPAERGVAHEPHLLSRVRVPEPGGRQLLLPLRRGARQGRAGLGDDDELHARGGRGGRRADAGGARRRGPGARRPLRRRALGRALRPAGRAHHDRPLAGLRRLPRRRHRLAQARRARAEGRRVLHRGPGQPRTAPSSTASASSRASWRTATSSRSASTS